MITLYVGRFQPFHKGHLHDIKKALEFSEKIIIGIGSAQEQDTQDNPLNFEERRQMIEAVLESENISNYKIFAIPDINDDRKWVDHVKSIISDFDIVYTGNARVKCLFREKDIPVKDIELLEGINATEIRKRMNNGESWKELVPQQVVDFLEKIDGLKRIRKINGTD